MKKFLFTTILVASFATSSAHANDGFNLSQLVQSNSAESSRILNNCLGTDASTTKALRACTKALRLATSNDVRSALYIKRAFLNLSKDNLKASSRDFKYANKIGAHPEYLRLGEGYIALAKGETKQAAAIFDECSGNKKTTSMAVYGRAIAKELMGDEKGAADDYRYAAELAPKWTVPATELDRVKAKL